MESNAVDDQVHVQPRSTRSMENAHINENGNTESLPSPPSSAKAGGLDIGHDENDSHSTELARGELSANRSSTNTNEGVNAADAMNSEPARGQLPDDVEKDRAISQDKDKSSKEGHYAATRDVGGEDDVSDAEPLGALLSEVRTDVLLPVLGDRLHERIKKAPKRVLQQIAYTQLMEDRISDLEKRLREIENKRTEFESSAPPYETKNQPAGLILGLKRMSFQEYLPSDSNAGVTTTKYVPSEHKRLHEFPGQVSDHLIDVVVSATNQRERLGIDQSTKPPAGSLNHTPPSLATSAQGLAASDGQYVQPERIRINSPLLLSILQRITGLILTTTKLDPMPKLLSQVILRPFKLLVTYEQEIRDEVVRLEKIHMPDDNEKKAETPGTTESEGQSPPPQPLTDTLHITPELSSQNYSEDLKHKENQTGASVDGETKDVFSLESKRCLEELRVLRELMDKDLKPAFDLRKQIKDGTAHSIAFQDLWHLFSLGDEIVSNDSNNQDQIYRIVNVCGGKPFLCDRRQVAMGRPELILNGREAGMGPPESTLNGRDLPKFEILCYYYDSDGKVLGACQKILTIKWYDGKKAITSLPCYPIIYSKDFRGLKPRDFYIERGKRFIELTRTTDVVHKRYEGLTLDELREEVDSEVIIDVSMALLKNNMIIEFGVTHELQEDPRETLEFLDPRCWREGCCQNPQVHKDIAIDRQRNAQLLQRKSFMRDFFEFDNELSEQDYLVCPCWVYGYALRSRKWVKLDISLVKDIKDGRSFDSLVLPPGHRETLLALVKTHSKGKKLGIGLRAENRQMDLVRGKGKGLIILLHGEPGVGKSSTAESVAEFTGRPLFQVTCGDIGESADEVEKRLENHFQLAHKWGCVLLLDEADVFLEARSKTDLKRNAIVSVFLRVLEYYSGILFLTTNRVGAFDQAFRSRIHMNFFYPRIEEEATVKIWEMNIARAREIWGDKLTIEEKDRKEILEFASKHYKELANSGTTWNGRQIRNAFQTAIALAEWDAHEAQLNFKIPIMPTPRLGQKHFERVANASKHFDAYLKETLAATAADLAREHHERRDDFGGLGS